MSAIPKCVHCNQGKVNRPSGLCWGCYYTPGVKERYRSTSVYARRGLGNENVRSLPLADEPCESLPGSPERVETYRKRVEAGRQIWHPGDRASRAG